MDGTSSKNISFTDADTCEKSAAVCAGFVEEFVCRYPEVLETLFVSRTTGNNIVWADEEHVHLGPGFGPDDQLSIERVTGAFASTVVPRTVKERAHQALRTKSRAEVFTPSWLCNRMNNRLDEDWFGRADAFNVEDAGGRSWHAVEEPVKLSRAKGRGLHAYIERRVLEIACGEAPFLACRYDATTGDPIPVRERVGVLDRKLRLASEHARSRGEWMRWALDALKATYGYEYQGDNLLIARVNVLETLCEHCQERWGEEPDADSLLEAARIVSWNLWQMDGLTCAVPTSRTGAAPRATLDDCPRSTPPEHLSLFDLPGEGAAHQAPTVPLCCIYDWDEDLPRTFAALKGNTMKKYFYAVIGNPLCINTSTDCLFFNLERKNSVCADKQLGFAMIHVSSDAAPEETFLDTLRAA